ncbi:MAG: hypothetical protein US52_C0042G0006 [candidate division WS6 bacterium GW2011_GWA2_37_6]|uniref:Uncharacterized protein n=1 Tax=candidate division WS6 bacterium GW2011_GWA2_37_6 TaxID=1619087 RepID=A0A0G0H8P9_9BACT|nr:MAG: hypothetical protein US52_C0042G0006 [candidate division WS6 bacterium GW2011_GWA2_37_6]
MGAINYSEDYVEQIFYIWYEHGKTTGSTFSALVPTSEDGRKPSSITIKDWMTTRGWIERADALDAEVARALDNTMIDKRKKMYEEQVEVADELLKLGRDFLKKNEFGGLKTGAEALRAIDLGLATKRISVGAPEAYDKISKMSDEQIAKELRNLLGKPKVDEDDIIEATISDTESK